VPTLRVLLTGLPVVVACLMLQVLFVSLAVRSYVRLKQARTPGNALRHDTKVLSLVMLFTLLGNLLQMAIWAALFLLLGEFEDFPGALYHSSVNFSTLGYGDVVMSERWRLLGPLEAINGILMFGISTSVMTATVIDVVKDNVAAMKRGEEALANAPPEH
jgi:hypothetical protein